MQKYIPFLITTISGLSTLTGLVFLNIKKEKNKIVKNTLAFSSGVMLSVSIFDLLPESIKLLTKSLTKNNLFIYIFLSILIGSIIPSLINRAIKEKENNLYRVGVLSMIAIIIHNIPEGIVTYLSAITNTKLGINMAIAIALHNIPEGISIAVPIYYSTKSKKKAFKYTLISALSEPLGAILTHLFLKTIITDKIMGILLALTAGLMSTIALTELLPKSLKYKEKKKTFNFFLAGTIIMYITIILMK